MQEVGRRGLMVLMGLVLPAIAEGQNVRTFDEADRTLEMREGTVFTVGAIDGEDWEVFGTVDAVAVGEDGSRYVLDGQNSRVVVFDDSGAHQRTLGRKGGGPGEFQLPQAMTVTDREEIVVYDMARRSYSILDSAGEFKRSVTTDMMALSARPAARLRPYPGGGFLSEYRGFDLDTGVECPPPFRT